MDEDLAAKLAESGFDADPETVSKIAGMGERAFSRLARMATSGPAEYGEEAMCAVHFLAALGHYRAQLAINSFLAGRYRDDADNDWVTAVLPGIIAHMGPKAIGSVSGLMRHSKADMYVRDAAARALVSMALDHPEKKPGIIDTIKGAVREEKDKRTRTFLAESLVELVEPDLYLYHENLLLTGAIDDDISGVETLEAIYEGSLATHAVEPTDPLLLFEQCRAQKDAPSRAEAQAAGPRSPGRNDPCPCGSAKKYKKCCMPGPGKGGSFRTRV